MQILNDINNLIKQINEGFESVVNSYTKLATDINDMEANKGQIMKLPMMAPQDKIALLQNHINNTEMLKQQLAAKQQYIANYGGELVSKHANEIKAKQQQQNPKK